MLLCRTRWYYDIRTMNVTKWTNRKSLITNGSQKILNIAGTRYCGL